MITLTPDTYTERVMPGVKFASDRSGIFPGFKVEDGGEGKITFLKTF